MCCAYKGKTILILENMTETVFYAIGDIHGQSECLEALHRRIDYKHQKDFPDLHGRILHLGDYVDRGPDSFGVIERVMRLEKTSRFDVVSLKGNHEQLMIQGCRSGKARAWSEWQANGGEATLQSYHVQGFESPCEHHLDWMEALPTMHWDRTAGYVFVHAGIDPRRFPHEDENVRLWTRSKSFFDSAQWRSPDLEGMIVVHGHTPTHTDQPEIAEAGRRINIDTGACFGGPLTAVILAPGRDVEFLQV